MIQHFFLKCQLTNSLASIQRRQRGLSWKLKRTEPGSVCPCLPKFISVRAVCFSFLCGFIMFGYDQKHFIEHHPSFLTSEFATWCSGEWNIWPGVGKFQCSGIHARVISQSAIISALYTAGSISQEKSYKQIREDMGRHTTTCTSYL